MYGYHFCIDTILLIIVNPFFEITFKQRRRCASSRAIVGRIDIDHLYGCWRLTRIPRLLHKLIRIEQFSVKVEKITFDVRCPFPIKLVEKLLLKTSRRSGHGLWSADECRRHIIEHLLSVSDRCSIIINRRND